MSEPRAVENITYQHYGANGAVSVNVRKNRTDAQTRSQVERMVRAYGGRFLNDRWALGVYWKTQDALAATGRRKRSSIGTISPTLISRQNNRR